ncbi:hypothetical protein Pst134EA_005399 [Puccinia striiformis f. sp. tritici]|uniref:hypothetical protein n=1 Tax=Puccinia striiformis f. sp. tritici TaxID=168172 RepID=UPI0020080AEE|nr:hypothetical protein Pst134EA_005399 [Puccinia striiformis f. sp. tritici]KAH9471504.1 hypothetical protein Pst134EA_005399 [Puccinia striiformis f. sp. tritici]
MPALQCSAGARTLAPPHCTDPGAHIHPRPHRTFPSSWPVTVTRRSSLQPTAATRQDGSPPHPTRQAQLPANPAVFVLPSNVPALFRPIKTLAKRSAYWSLLPPLSIRPARAMIAHPLRQRMSNEKKPTPSVTGASKRQVNNNVVDVDLDQDSDAENSKATNNTKKEKDGCDAPKLHYDKPFKAVDQTVGLND